MTEKGPRGCSGKLAGWELHAECLDKKSRLSVIC